MEIKMKQKPQTKTTSTKPPGSYNLYCLSGNPENMPEDKWPPSFNTHIFSDFIKIFYFSHTDIFIAPLILPQVQHLQDIILVYIFKSICSVHIRKEFIRVLIKMNGRS